MNNYSLINIISIYQNETKDDHYIEISEIDKDNNIKNTRPLALETLSKLTKLSYNKELTTTRILPKEIIYVSFKTDVEIIAYRNPCKRMFTIKDKFSKIIIYPSLLFHLKRNKLSVYCIKKYIRTNTKLYYNPFPNNTGNTSICMGNVKIVNDDYVKLINEYIEAFYNSTFTMEGLGRINTDIPLEEFYDSLDEATNISSCLQPILNFNKTQRIISNLIYER